jgi:hypothetical protein
MIIVALYLSISDSSANLARYLGRVHGYSPGCFSTHANPLHDEFGSVGGPHHGTRSEHQYSPVRRSKTNARRGHGGTISRSSLVCQRVWKTSRFGWRLSEVPALDFHEGENHSDDRDQSDQNTSGDLHPVPRLILWSRRDRGALRGCEVDLVPLARHGEHATTQTAGYTPSRFRPAAEPAVISRLLPLLQRRPIIRAGQRMLPQLPLVPCSLTNLPPYL